MSEALNLWTNKHITLFFRHPVYSESKERALAIEQNGPLEIYEEKSICNKTILKNQCQKIEEPEVSLVIVVSAVAVLSVGVETPACREASILTAKAGNI